MNSSMKISNRLVWISLVLLFFGKVSLQKVQAFDSYVIHPALAQIIALHYNNQNPDDPLSESEIEWFTQGALEEDESSIRALNHFFNPIKNEGLRVGGVLLGLSAPEWAYAKNQQQLELGGDCSWSTAITAYQTGDKAKAFRCLGHVLHLMEDMGVPAHTRNDQHLVGDPFEQWAKYHNPIPVDEAISEPNCTTGKDCITSLGTWINKNFVSKNTINNIDFESPFNNATIDGKYLTANQIKLAVYNPKNRMFSLTEEIQADYWQKISPMIKAYGEKLITIFILEAKNQPMLPLPSQNPSITITPSDRLPSAITSPTTPSNPAVTFKSLIESIKPPELIPTKIPFIPKKETSPIITKKIIEPVPDTYIIKRPASTIKETTAQFVFSSDISTARFECSSNIFSWFDCGSSYYITGLEPGRHSLFVRAVSEVGHDLTPQYYSWLVDTSAPKTILVAITNKFSRQASFHFISEIGAKFDCRLDVEEWKECISPFKSEELGSGKHTFSVRARDKVGNIEEEPDFYHWTIEMARPVSPVITFPQKSPYYTRSSEIVISGSVAPTLKVIGSDNLEQKEVEPILDHWSYNPLLSIGENIFSFRAINDYGEESLSVSTRIIYDVDPPEIKYVNFPEINTSEDFSISWEGNDNSNGSLSYDVMFRWAVGEWQSWLEKTTQTEAQFINEFPSEDIFFRIRAIDQAGNISDWLEKNIIGNQIVQTDHLVISQIIPKGRNGSADEFIEIYNPTSLLISLQGFSIQKKSKSEIIWHAIVPAAQHELAVVSPHGYYLFTGASYSYLTTPDVAVLNELLHDENGHVRIVNNLGLIIDRLGYGQANSPEINAAPQPSLGVSLHRKAQSSSTALSLSQFPNLGNGYDSNNNFNDFVLQTEVLPKNSQTVF